MAQPDIQSLAAEMLGSMESYNSLFSQQAVVEQRGGWRNNRLIRLGAPALIAVGVVGPQISSYAPDRTAETPAVVEIDGAELAVASSPNEVGSNPFGPNISAEVANARAEAGQPIVQTSERDQYLEDHPEVDRAVSEFWTNIDLEDDNSRDFLDYVFTNKDVTSPEMLEGDNDSVAEELKARQELIVTEQAFEVQNHAWKNGRVTEFNNIEAIGANEQVRGIRFSQAELDAMHAEGVTIPDSMVVITLSNGDTFVVLERGPCENPLLDREKVAEPQPEPEATPEEEEPTPTPTPTETEPTPTPTPTETEPTPTPTETEPTPTPTPTETEPTPTPTETPLPTHPPATGPPPEVTQPPYEQDPTEGYDDDSDDESGEEIIEDQQGDEDNLDETDSSTEIDDSEDGTSGEDSPGGGEDGVVEQPEEDAEDNPDFDPDIDPSDGTDEGTSGDEDSEETETEGTDETSGPGTDPGGF